MHLVVFDIDGTLTQTYEADESCFVQALDEVFGFTEINTDWASHRHATDSGILQEIHESRTGRVPGDTETLRFRQHFVRLLERASFESPFAPVGGAPLLLSRLACSAEHRVAIATGALSDSARFKMASAGMCFDDYPAASADDALAREAIMQLSIQRAVEWYGGPFASTVYVGDGIWDARACRALGIPFIGIGSGDRAIRLASEGAVRVFQDFSKVDLFLETLNELR